MSRPQSASRGTAPPPGTARLTLRIAIGLAIILAGCLIGVALLANKKDSGEAVNLTFRIAVDPADQLPLVLAEAGSAKFKYLVGKRSGVKPAQAQNLELGTVSDPLRIEARVGLATDEEAQRYVEAFLRTLQWQCGKRARLSLIDQSVR